jgi:hypothetical protein
MEPIGDITGTIYATYMFHIWRVAGTIWSIYGACMDHIWTIYGLGGTYT